MLTTRAIHFLLLLLAGVGVSPLAAETPRESAGDDKAADHQLLDVKGLASRAKPSLFVIHGAGRDGQQDRIGTGFAVGKNLIATNLHVIGEGRDFTIEDADGRELVAEAIVASDRLFDLAVVQVRTDDDRPLQPLKLGSPDELQEGEPIVVLGNPLGYKHSVVSGVLSGKRKIEGRNMLQMAVPIEPGNSGGPVLNREGRVFGVVTMKSTASNNLGFAVESSAIERLLSNPNPVKIARWVVMNRIDSRRWEAVFGARWQQRGGKILVNGQGKGFGGRSLCIWQEEPPATPFEVAVDVKLDDESGAAGLIFHSDGKDRHYGFYPSNGKLRFSCFQGPSVYSWKVLHDEPSAHYRAGQWNRLKVRVEEELIRCYLNGELLFQSSDKTFAAGRVGLAKFRQTEAEFKGFQVGKEIGSQQIADELRDELLKQIESFTKLEETTSQEIVPLSKQPAASIELLREQAQTLEQRAQQLRQLAQDVHVQNVTEELEELLHGQEAGGRKQEEQEEQEEQENAEDEVSERKDPPDLLRAALLLARIDDEELDVRAYIDAVDYMADEIAEQLGDDEATEPARLAALTTYLFEDNGYHGSRADYYHRANSHIHRVIDDREGLPITLSVLFMELGERLELNIEGVSLPGHFIVRFRPSAEHEKPQLIDVYESGRQLSPEEAAQKSQEITGEPLDSSELSTATTSEILHRMLVNLLHVAQQEGDKEAMLRYLHGLLAVDENSVQYRGMRAVVRFETGRRDASLADLDWLIERQPDGLDIQQVRQMRNYFQHNRPAAK